MDLQLAHFSKWDAPSGYEKREDWINEWYFNEAIEFNTSKAFLGELPHPERPLALRASERGNSHVTSLAHNRLTGGLFLYFLFC